MYSTYTAAAKSLQSCPTFCDLWSIAHQVPLSVGLSRQEYWSGLPCPPPEDLPNPGTEPASLKSPALAGRFFTNISMYMFSHCGSLKIIMNIIKISLLLTC